MWIIHSPFPRHHLVHLIYSIVGCSLRLNVGRHYARMPTARQSSSTFSSQTTSRTNYTRKRTSLYRKPHSLRQLATPNLLATSTTLAAFVPFNYHTRKHIRTYNKPFGVHPMRSLPLDSIKLYTSYSSLLSCSWGTFQTGIYLGILSSRNH